LGGNAWLDAGQLRREADVVGDGQAAEQVEELEDEADPPAAEACQGSLAEGGEVDAVDHHRAAAWTIQAGDEVEQGGLAAARRAYHGDECTAWTVRLTPHRAGAAS